MHKRILALSLVCLSLVGCSSRDRVLDANIPTEEVVQQETETEIKEEPVEEVTLTKDKIKAIEKYLKDSTYMAFTEEVRSGVYDETVDTLFTRQCYDVMTDTISKVTYVGISNKMNSNELYDVSYPTVYVSDLKKNKYYINTIGEYEKEKGKTKVIDWDLRKYKNCYDMYSFLLNGFSIGADTQGYVNDDEEVYVKETKADESMLKNVSYDTLNKCITTYVLSKGKPVSAETKIVYEKNKETYYYAIKLTFNEISKREMTLKTLGINK